MNQAYVYKWTHLPTMKWYIGSRTSKKSHLNDGYICSSRLVKPLIESAPGEWAKTIIAIGNAEEMYDLETEILQSVDARNDPRSFNQYNNDGKWTRTGTVNSPETRSKLSASLQGHTYTKGIPKSDSHRANMSKASKGKPKSAAHRANMAAAATQRWAKIKENK